MPSILPYTPYVLFKWCLCYFHHQHYHYYFITLGRSWHSSALPTFVSHTFATELHFSTRKNRVSSWENTCRVAPSTCGALEILLKEKVTEAGFAHFLETQCLTSFSLPCCRLGQPSQPSLDTWLQLLYSCQGPAGQGGATRLPRSCPSNIHSLLCSFTRHSLCCSVHRDIKED